MPVPVEDAASSALSLAEVERLALERHPALGVARARIAAAGGRRLQAGLRPNPVVGYHATEIGNVGTAGQQGAFVGQRFVTGGKLAYARGVGTRETEFESRGLDVESQRILNEVRTRFFVMLTEQERIRLTKRLLEIGEEAVTRTERLLDGRIVGRPALLQARIEADNADVLHRRAMNAADEAWRRLAVAAAVPDAVRQSVVGDVEAGLADFAWDERLAAVVAASPEIDRARSAVDVARARLARANREWIPDVDVGLSIRHHNVTGSDVVNVQATIPVPIFDRNQGGVHAAHAELVRARREVDRVELAVRDRLARTFRRYRDARVQVETYHDRILPNAKESLDLIGKAYGEGQRDYLTLLVAQRTYVRASLDYLDALLELRTAQVALEGLLVGAADGGTTERN